MGVREEEITTEQVVGAYWDTEARNELIERHALSISDWFRLVREKTAGVDMKPPPAPPVVEIVERRGKPGTRTDVEVLVRYVELAPRLPRRVRQVFELCIEDGLSIQECASRLGLGYETVRTHLRRLRAMVPRRFYEQTPTSEDMPTTCSQTPVAH